MLITEDIADGLLNPDCTTTVDSIRDFFWKLHFGLGDKKVVDIFDT